MMEQVNGWVVLIVEPEVAEWIVQELPAGDGFTEDLRKTADEAAQHREYGRTVRRPGVIR